jgi:hypothetical protein
MAFASAVATVVVLEDEDTGLYWVLSWDVYFLGGAHMADTARRRRIH